MAGGRARRARLEDRIVDRLGGEVGDEGGKPLEQRDPHLAVGVGEQLDDGGHHLCSEEVGRRNNCAELRRIAPELRPNCARIAPELRVTYLLLHLLLGEHAGDLEEGFEGARGPSAVLE